MTPDELVAAFSSLSATDQWRVLAEYAHGLTVIARGTYVPQTEDVADPRRLRMLNEVQHRVIGHLQKLISGSAERYSDDAIVRIIIGEDDAELLTLLETAVKRRR